MRFDFEHGPAGQVRDANGEVIPDCVRGDTETGLVERTKTVQERHPAPLTVTPAFKHRPDVFGYL